MKRSPSLLPIALAISACGGQGPRVFHNPEITCATLLERHGSAAAASTAAPPAAAAGECSKESAPSMTKDRELAPYLAQLEKDQERRSWGVASIDVGVCAELCFVQVRGLESGSTTYYDRAGRVVFDSSGYAYDKQCNVRSAGSAPSCERQVVATLPEKKK